MPKDYQTLSATGTFEGVDTRCTVVARLALDPSDATRDRGCGLAAVAGAATAYRGGPSTRLTKAG